MKITHTKELQAILDQVDSVFNEIHGFGSLNGGCYMLVSALKHKIKNSKIYGVGMGGTTFHFVLSIGKHLDEPFIWDETKGNFVIDYAGIFTKTDSIVDDYVGNTRLSRKHVEVFDHTQEYGVNPGIINDEGTINKLLDLLPNDIEDIILQSKTHGECSFQTTLD